MSNIFDFRNHQVRRNNDYIFDKNNDFTNAKGENSEDKVIGYYEFNRINANKFIDFIKIRPKSTGVKENKDGSYTIINAKNDGDNGTGKFGGVAKNKDGSNIVLKNNDINLYTLLYKYRYKIDNGIKNYNIDLLNLAYSSKNKGYLDLKESLGKDKYSSVKVGENYTSLRAASNILFGFNLRNIYEKYKNDADFKDKFKDAEDFYRYTMQVVGAYNQFQNNRKNFIKGKGYNKDFPFYGEHAYSGANIYRGYFRQFTTKKLHK